MRCTHTFVVCGTVCMHLYVHTYVRTYFPVQPLQSGVVCAVVWCGGERRGREGRRWARVRRGKAHCVVTEWLPLGNESDVRWWSHCCCCCGLNGEG